jgi:hypothetical protein
VAGYQRRTAREGAVSVPAAIFVRVARLPRLGANASLASSNRRAERALVSGRDERHHRIDYVVASDDSLRLEHCLKRATRAGHGSHGQGHAGQS